MPKQLQYIEIYLKPKKCQSNNFILVVKSFIEIANKITPKIFLIIPIPFSPIIFSILLEPFNIIYK